MTFYSSLILLRITEKKTVVAIFLIGSQVTNSGDEMHEKRIWKVVTVGIDNTKQNKTYSSITCQLARFIKLFNANMIKNWKCLKISQNFTSNRSGVWSKWLSFKQADPTSGISRIFNSLIPLKQLHWLSLAVNSKRWPFKLSTYSTLWIKLTINTCKRWAINSKLSSISCSFFELMWITWKNLLLVPS